MSAETLIRITAPHFCAGIILDADDHVIRTAPILKWTHGKTAVEIVTYAGRKGWLIERVAL